MKLWLQDESDYPSGFAGETSDREHPEFENAGLVADIRSRNARPDAHHADPAGYSRRVRDFRVHTGTIQNLPPEAVSNGINWRAPAPPQGASGYPKPWELVLVRHMFRSSPDVQLQPRGWHARKG